jgi:toxin FitB
VPSYLLDTCFVSEFSRKRPSPRVSRWEEENRQADFFLSALTIGEIWKGIELLAEGERQQRLRIWLDEDILAIYRENVLFVDERVARAWGVLAGELQRRGRVLPAVDGLIAATALVHGLTLVTRNEDDFHGTGVKLVNPWGQDG